MRIYHNFEHLPKFRNPVVAVGSFDGVHLGHQQILAFLKKAAQRYDGESIVLTFHPHPQQVLHPERDFFLINTPEENAELIEQQEIDNLIFIEFTTTFSQLSPNDFIKLLIEKIGIKAVVMGPRHNFGKNGEGNSTTMREICAKNSIEIITIPEFILEENKVRSSKIREHIVNKEFRQAELLLGHPLKKN
ncbi:MAG: FAD synthetase family protein [Bacteroidales bacterium]|nr:FAD synthetase family protein [Bacteroidales bacterium]